MLTVSNRASNPDRRSVDGGLVGDGFVGRSRETFSYCASLQMADPSLIMVQNILGPSQVEVSCKRQLGWCFLNGSAVGCNSQSKNKDAGERLREHGARRGWILSVSDLNSAFLNENIDIHEIKRKVSCFHMDDNSFHLAHHYWSSGISCIVCIYGND
jgi:hypothetical protein